MGKDAHRVHRSRPSPPPRPARRARRAAERAARCALAPPAALIVAVAVLSALAALPLTGCAPRWVAREQARRAGDAPEPRRGAPSATPHGTRPGTQAGGSAAPVSPTQAPLGSTAGPAAADPTALARGQAIAETARQLIGSPYVAGGAAPTGFDCSGLVAYVYARHGVKLPRSAEDQAKAGRSLVSSEVLPGDLLFFRVNGDEISHVGIHVGGWRFVHAPRHGQKVRLDSLGDPYWGPRYAGARRP